MKHRQIALLLALLFLFVGLAAGCKKSGDPGVGTQLQTDRQEQAIDRTDPSETEDNVYPWMTLGEPVYLINSVAQMVWVVDDTIFSYGYEGIENVNGQDAHAIAIDAGDDHCVFWLDPKGTILQAAINDDFFESGIENVYMMEPLLPFQLIQNEKLQRALTGSKVQGWTIQDRGTQRLTLGEYDDALEIDARTLVIRGTDLFDTGAEGEYAIAFRFARVLDQWLLIGWEVLDGGNPDEPFAYFSLESIRFHNGPGETGTSRIERPSASGGSSVDLDKVLKHFKEHGMIVEDVHKKDFKLLGAVDGLGLTLEGGGIELYLFDSRNADEYLKDRLEEARSSGLFYDLRLSRDIPVLVNGDIMLFGLEVNRYVHPEKDWITAVFLEY